MTQHEYVWSLVEVGVLSTCAEQVAARVFENWGPGFVYCYRDITDGEILYVGSAKDFKVRHQDHRRKAWYQRHRPTWRSVQGSTTCSRCG